MNDKKFVCLVIAICLGLLFTWWILSQPSPCKLIQYQDLSGTHDSWDCSHA